jgi:hypothetical protein
LITTQLDEVGVSKVVSLRFHERQFARLRRLARRLGRTPSETGALLVEEALRRAEFAYIDFRESAAGRQAYVSGTSLAIWEVVLVARDYAMDEKRTAEHLAWPIVKVRAALAYASAYPDEITDALEDLSEMNFGTLTRMLPQTTTFVAR